MPSYGSDDELEAKLARREHDERKGDGSEQVSSLEAATLRHSPRSSPRSQRSPRSSPQGSSPRGSSPRSPRSPSALEQIAQGKDSPRSGSPSAEERAADPDAIGREETKEVIPDAVVDSGWSELWGAQRMYSFADTKRRPVSSSSAAAAPGGSLTDLGWRLLRHDTNVKLCRMDKADIIRLLRAFALIQQSWAQIVAKAFFALKSKQFQPRKAPGKGDGQASKPQQKQGGEEDAEQKQGGEEEVDDEIERKLDDSRNLDDEMQRKLEDETNADTAEQEEDRQRQRALARKRAPALKALRARAKLPSRKGRENEQEACALMDALNDEQRHQRWNDRRRFKQEHIDRLLEINATDGRKMHIVSDRSLDTLLHINESGQRGDAQVRRHVSASDRGDRDHVKGLLNIDSLGRDVRRSEGLNASVKWARIDNSLVISDNSAKEEGPPRGSGRGAAHQRHPFEELLYK